MTKEDGGPAFPTIDEGHRGIFSTGGMSFRDWFAGQALAGVLASPLYNSERDEQLAHLARRLYQMADAMLAERNRNSAAPKTAE